MQSRELKQYDDAKKHLSHIIVAKQVKKYTTHEDRCNYYNRFLTPLNSLAIGTMMLTAGVDRAMADQSRALQHPSNSGDSTGLTPAFNQTEFNNPSRETALYNSLRDLGMTDEQILKIQQQDQQLKQKHEER